MTRTFYLVRATKPGFISSVDPTRRQGSWRFSVYLGPARTCIDHITPRDQLFAGNTMVAPKGSSHNRYAQVWGRMAAGLVLLGQGKEGGRTPRHDPEKESCVLDLAQFQLVCPKGDRSISCVNMRVDAKQRACQSMRSTVY